MGIAHALPLPFLLCAALAQAAEPAGFRGRVAGVDVDWSAGTLTAQGGAAADLRMPSPNAARPGAERRARAAALAKLRAALHELLPAASFDEKQAAPQTSVARIEYQSNGGVVLWLELRLADVVAAPPATIALRASSMPFALAPAVAADGKTVTLGLATYRPAAQAPKDAVAVRAEKGGRLALGAGQAKLLDELAGHAVVIYLDRPAP
jgi:hypothetical protein